ncbi:MAG: hypothetical protein JWM65_3339, partial [Sphingomonas bacterium]|nr:hypothetical protein [Sphingomonas bacterium]
MATIAEEVRRPTPLAADRYEKILAGAAALLLLTVLVALLRGHAQWGLVP